MIKDRTVISLDPNEVIELTRIVLDSDRDEALVFLEHTIMKKVKQANRPHCKPVFELQGREPDFITEKKQTGKEKGE